MLKRKTIFLIVSLKMVDEHWLVFLYAWSLSMTSLGINIGNLFTTHLFDAIQSLVLDYYFSFNRWGPS